MGSSSPSESPLHNRPQRQELVADLGRQALETGDLDGLLDEVVVGIAAGLDAPLSQALELRPDGNEALLRRGVGWDDGLVGTAAVPTDGSTAGRALETGEPVAVDDLRADERSAAAEVLTDRDVVAAVSVVVGPRDDPWGVLEAYATEEAAFADADVAFLRSVANVLASVVETDRVRDERDRELDRYERLVERLPVGVYRNTPGPDGEFVEVNDTMLSIFDADSEAELLDCNVSDLYPDPEQRSAFSERLEREGVVEDVELKQETLDGRTIWISVTAMRTEEDGEVYFDGIVRDVTERKRTQQRLAEERDMFAEGPAVVFRWRNEAEWPVEYVSENVEDVFGYAPAELESGDVPYTDLLLEEEIDRIAAEVAEHSDETTERFSHEPYRVRTKDGEIRWVKDTTKVVRDESGEITHYLGYLVDITERELRERELEESERRYRALVEHFPNGAVALVDEDLRYRTVGGEPERIAEATADEIEGRPVAEAVPPELADELVPRYEAALEGATDSFEAALDGRHFRFQIVPVRDGDGEVFAALGTSQDVTERTEHERMLAKYETIFETIDDGIYVKDEDGRFTMVNQAYAEMTGYGREELLGEHASLVVDESTIQQSRATLDSDDGHRVMVADIETADGDRVPAEATFATLETGGGEQEEIGVVRDVTERRERERELERYETIVEAVHDGVYVVDEDGRFTMVNDSYAEMTGYDREELLGEHVTTVVDEDVAEAARGIEAEMHDGRFDGTPIEAELETRDGERVPAEATFAILETGDGADRRVGVVRDVTERREYERALEESERRYRAMAEHFPNGLVTLFDEDLRYELAAGQGFDGISVDPGDVEGHHFREVWDAATADALEPVFEAALDGEERSVELTYEDRDWILYAVPVTDEDGEVFAGMTMAQDVTERKERQRALERSERRYRTLVESYPDGAVGLFDEDLEYTAIGGQLLDELGLDTDDRVGESVSDIYPDDLLEEVEPYFEAALEGESNAFEVEFHDRLLHANTLPVRDADDDVFAGMLVVQDVTERREYERRLEESNERLEQFAYAASHDLQEPLRMVSSYLQLIESRYAAELDEDGREFLDYAVDGADRMREMIEGLLEYSRVETRGDPFEPVALDDVLADVRDDLQLRIEETGAEIDADALPTVEGDRGQLRQVFQNLLDNAIEYSGDEPPRIHVGAERTGDEWTVSVSDEGIGIDPDDAERVFEVFERLHTHEEHEGTGIGLALCRRIVERHGGEVGVDSEPGEGTTISFTLPAADGGR